MAESDCFSFYRIVLVYVFFLRLSRHSHLVSIYNFSMLHNLVAPVTILAASIWIDSNSFFNSNVQLSHILSLYSIKGRINEK